MSTDFIKTAVIGHPIGHSKSPLIHNFWIEHYGLQGQYRAIDIDPDKLQEGVQDLIAQGYKGFNVTVPHKVSIMELCDALSDIAKEVGAVNTVTIEDGRLIGTNTDGYGFIENLKENAPSAWRFENGTALVLGAGGAANAIVHALCAQNVPDIVLTNRTRAKAEYLQERFASNIRVIDWEERHIARQDINLVVNTTALGMQGQAPLEIELSDTSKGCLVTDIVYAPLQTDLLKQAQDLGLPTVTGIGMLLHQARPGFEAWNGILPDVTPELERMVLR